MPSDLILALQGRVPNPSVPPLTDGAIAEAEARLGFPIPPLLRELYQHVGNGRFGPLCGILSLTDSGDREPSAVDIYSDMRRDDPTDRSWNWPAGLLPFCDWGCNIYSCVECIGSPYPVLTYEYVEGPMEHSFAPTRDSLEAWLRDWLAGIEVLEYEDAPERDRVIMNPFTKEPWVIKGRRPRRR
jgi:SMI1 / KNR4 family (SUKH-1)